MALDGTCKRFQSRWTQQVTTSSIRICHTMMGKHQLDPMKHLHADMFGKSKPSSIDFSSLICALLKPVFFLIVIFTVLSIRVSFPDVFLLF